MTTCTPTLIGFHYLTIAVLVQYYKRLTGTVYYVEATPTALALGKLLLPTVHFQRLDFRLMDLKDPQGNLWRLWIGYQDLNELQKLIFASDDIKHFYATNTLTPELDMFLKKQSVSFVNNQNINIFRLLIMIYAFNRQAKQLMPNASLTFVSISCGWDKEVSCLVAAKGIALECVTTIEWSLRQLLKNVLGVINYRSIYYALLLIKKFRWPNICPKPQQPKIMAEYYGQCDFSNKEQYSDLFFLSSGVIPSNQAALALNFPNDPLDEKRYAYLNAQGVAVYALHPQSSAITNIPYFFSLPTQQGKSIIVNRNRVGQWLNKQTSIFNAEKNYWKKFFDATNAKIYINWFKYDAAHSYRTQAMRESGGVTVYFQRSFEPMPSIETALAVDVLFLFSKLSLTIEQASGSNIPYGVIVGYPGTYQSPSLDKSAAALREQLTAKGADKIIAFFDENSGDDARWHTGHDLMRANYEILLNHVLANPLLGLILKPKVPKTLMRRLGPIAGLLQRALNSGRCIILESDGLYNTLTPALAAKAADIAIHGHFCAATAGIESALSGTPTLLLDREGFSFCPLKKRWGSNIVFDSWTTLWQALEDHLLRVPNKQLGNWDHILDDIDPYRDNKARERMTYYLNQLLDGFNRQLDRNTVLANAAQAFAARWGSDKIIAIKGVNA